MMSFASSLKFPIYLTLMTTLLSATSLIDGAIFTVTNNCSYTIWAAAIPGGGQLLNPSQTWFINVSEGTTGRIWARTGCIFNESGYESYVSCQTGDCKGLLRCQTYGTPPNTLAEYALNQFMTNLDFFDISLVDGFNVPMDFSPTSNWCTRGIRCSADINGQCPAQLRAPGGCNNPCTVFKTSQYCCNSRGRCDSTDFSRFFKTGCPNAYSYPKDDQTSTFTCPGGTNYRVVFCPEAVLTKTTTSNITVSTVNVNCSQSILPAQTKIAAVAPAFKGCNKQFYFSLTK